MQRTAKLAIYRAARAAGLFRRARQLTRNRLRILAYHAFGREDELLFRPKLFIRPETFRRRLEQIRQDGYHVVRLDDAVAQLAAGSVDPDSLVITIDDGFASTVSIAPILREFGFPATVYLTTYYMRRQSPVFDLAVAYLVWKTQATAADLVGLEGRPSRRLDLSSPRARGIEVQSLIDYGKTLDGEPARVELCRALGKAVGVDYDRVAQQGAFRLLSFDEARRLVQMKLDIGLHTHRHRFPADDLSTCRAELDENRRLLADELGVTSAHFCYPSGVHSPAHLPLLRELGIVSATTCEAGLAGPRHSLLSLPRFLDGEMVADIEFEAELSGFAHLARTSVS